MADTISEEARQRVIASLCDFYDVCMPRIVSRLLRYYVQRVPVNDRDLMRVLHRWMTLALWASRIQLTLRRIGRRFEPAAHGTAFIGLVSHLIPRRHREHFIGDLLEDCTEYRRVGWGRYRILLYCLMQFMLGVLKLRSLTWWTLIRRLIP